MTDKKKNVEEKNTKDLTLTTQENQNNQISDNINNDFNYSLDSYKNYMAGKLTAATLSVTIVSSLRGYYVGDAMALYFYSALLYGGVIHTALFSGTYLLRNLRKKEDDMISYGVSGAVNGSWISVGFGGLRKIPTGMGLGGIYGVSYYFVSTCIYQGLRIVWLRGRKYALIESREHKFFNRDIHPDALPQRQPKLPDWIFGKETKKNEFISKLDGERIRRDLAKEE